MGKLLNIEDFKCFESIRDISPRMITSDLVKTVRELDEREELEPFIRSILHDPNETAHGPAEIVDILTHKVSVRNEAGIAAFILKGKSFAKVRHSHVAHQIYRLEKIAGLNFAIFAATGTILDDAKEHFCSTAERLNCRYAILDANDLARLFIAYGFLCPRDAKRITAGRCKCGYSPPKRILNVFQIESLKALKEAHEIGQAAGLIVLPPGSGKTRIAAEDAKKFDAKRILYVAHTHEILDVAISEFEAIFGRTHVTKHINSRTLSTPNRVNITTIQLLQKNMSSLPACKYDYLIMDEFHHAAARSYRQLIDNVKYRFLLGLTATPFRADRQDILALCNQNLLVNFELRTGIEMGILAPYHYFGCFDDVDYSMIRMKWNGYDIRDLEKALIIPERDAAIIDKWKEHALEKPTIAFCCSHRHAQRIAKSFRDNGITAEVYLSSTRKSKRDKLIQMLQSGDLRILCTVDVINEGADFPFLECLLFLRPTESQRIFYQQLGRGLRRYVGKSHCTVIDFIGNFKNAYKIVEYQGLLPYAYETAFTFGKIKSGKDVLNLPLGCKVHFDDKVIDIFARQILDPRIATRHNIGKILLYQYQKLAKRIGHLPSRLEVDRNLILHSKFYRQVFGTWTKFLKLFEERS